MVLVTVAVAVVHTFFPGNMFDRTIATVCKREKGKGKGKGKGKREKGKGKGKGGSKAKGISRHGGDKTGQVPYPQSQYSTETPMSKAQAC